jgi:hypothetical protein
MAENWDRPMLRQGPMAPAIALRGAARPAAANSGLVVNAKSTVGKLCRSAPDSGVDPRAPTKTEIPSITYFSWHRRCYGIVVAVQAAPERKLRVVLPDRPNGTELDHHLTLVTSGEKGFVMNTQKLIAATAGAVFILGAAATAQAQVDPQVSGSFSVYVSNASGNSGWSNSTVASDVVNGSATAYNGASTSLASSFGSAGSGSGGSSNSFSQSFTSEPSPNYALIAITPPGSSGTDDTATINVSFTGLKVVVGTTTYTATGGASFTGTFSADYSGTLSCASGDAEGSGGQTDCIEWSGTNGAETDLVALAGTTDTLDITLNPYTDWTVQPSVDFTVNQPNQTVPEPASMVLFASGLLGLPVIRRRMARKAPKAA